MNQVLASTAGNALEVREAVQFLTGEACNPRLLEVTLALCSEMMISDKLAANEAEARQKLQTPEQSSVCRCTRHCQRDG